MHKILFVLLCLLGFNFTEILAQSAPFNDDNYQKALWMTTRMYGGQRSGNDNWYLANYLAKNLPGTNSANKPVAEKYRGKSFIEDKDTVTFHDLSGGWHDCGDHVKFGQTEFYSGYTLLKGYAEFPKGYDDHYSQTYEGYKTSGKWYWEETGHDPDGIPDVVNEVKHATDFFIKCALDENTFYSQVGDGDADHRVWCTSVLKQTLSKYDGGQKRFYINDAKDASMPSFCGATLALMGRIYKKHDAAYADLCIAHAKIAYAYAKKQNGTVPAGNYYPANAYWKDDFVTMCCELYWATGEEKYKTEALSFSVGSYAGNGDIYGNNVYCYNDNGDIALYNLALLGKPKADSLLNLRMVEHAKNVNGNGLFQGGDASWGPLRYNANAAWMYALNLKLRKQATSVPKFIYDQIDFILGKNSSNLSFVVGFGAKSPKYPHHRDIYRGDGGDDKKPGDIPAQNKQSGIMVGGKRNPSEFVDSPTDYRNTEGGIDYQVGLVGALAYINSIRKPVDLAKFPDFPEPSLTSLNTPDYYNKSIQVFPNPSSSNFTLSLEEALEVSIYDNLGRLIHKFDAVAGERIFGHELKPGLYHVNFAKAGKILKSSTIVKN